MGFDREKIIGNVNENCFCAICQDVLEDAVQAKGENSSKIKFWLNEIFNR